jgi:hypothetical protein
MEIVFKIRVDLMNYINFIELAAQLMPASAGGGVLHPHTREGINEVINFINRASKEETLIKGPELLNTLEPMLKECIRCFPLKKSLEEVSAAYRKLRKEDDMVSNGIPLSWLDKYIDAGRVLAGYTPYQARIGIGRHAGRFALEESFLLTDGFYFLVSAQKAWDLLNSFGKDISNNVKNNYVIDDFYTKVSSVNHNVCMLSRNSIINLYSFIECFVNSVGYDFFLRNESTLPIGQQEVLKGKKGGFLSLEYKIEKFPLIISPKSKQSIFTIDIKQRKRPFIKFLDEYKELRDASMHYSPLKSDILRKPGDWVKKARNHSEIVVEVARLFWRACYPQVDFPSYLKQLDYQKCYREGEIRYESMLVDSK